MTNSIVLLFSILELIFKVIKTSLIGVFIVANSVRPHHPYRPKHRRREGPPEVGVPESNLASRPKILMKLRSSPNHDNKMRK